MFSSNASQVSNDVNYIEDVFSTYLYASTSSTDNQIVNGIDLAGEGGMVWIKSRTRAATNHYLVDTVRGSSLGVSNTINSNTANAQATGANLDWVQFNSNGFTAKAVVGGGELGTNTYYGDMVGWTFRKQPKFFDVVTFTLDGTETNKRIPQSLESVPGCIIIKRTTATSDWFVWHRSLASATDSYITLNTTGAATSYANVWGSTGPTSTDFGVNGALGAGTWIAYLYAHDAGGFGLSGNENVVSCGSVTSNGSGAGSVTLGYEPQWVLLKNSQAGENWQITDNMRGMPVGSADALLLPNSSAAESSYDDIDPTSTGFNVKGLNSSQTYIYIAIRRGPMKVPTDGTTVFKPVARTGTSSVITVSNIGFAPDLVATRPRDTAYSPYWFDRLRGGGKGLSPNSTNAEITVAGGGVSAFGNDSFTLGTQQPNTDGERYINWNFRRAPSFFDEVCYTGTGVARTVAHSLAAVPELMIVKGRNIADGWRTYNFFNGSSASMNLNDDGRSSDIGNVFWNSTTPTASVFSLGTEASVNGSGSTYVAYLFATCAGVSKVGSYTGTGTTQAINCGFTSGARFVLIKRTNVEGDWYVWDSARGIVANSDPYLFLNSTAAEVTGTDYIDPSSAGFEISSTAPAAINASGGSFIFLAVA